MDNDPKPYFSLAGGLLAFVGAAISFLNSRMNEAATKGARNKLWARVATITEITLWALCAFSIVIFKLYLLGSIFAFLAYGVFIFRFNRFRTGDITRPEVVFISLETSVFVFMVLISVMHRMIDLMGRILDILSKIPPAANP